MTDQRTTAKIAELQARVQIACTSALISEIRRDTWDPVAVRYIEEAGKIADELKAIAGGDKG